jgi:hypothetical protein
LQPEMQDLFAADGTRPRACLMLFSTSLQTIDGLNQLLNMASPTGQDLAAKTGDLFSVVSLIVDHDLKIELELQKLEILGQALGELYGANANPDKRVLHDIVDRLMAWHDKAWTSAAAAGWLKSL